jgi:hypothetical protein
MLKKFTFIAIILFNVASHASEQFSAVFTEQLLQPYFTCKEAYAMMLVSKFHNAQQQYYRNKRIELHKEETKEGSTSSCKIAFNHLGVHPLYIGFDISGNGARGISSDGTKIIDFEVHPYYRLKNAENIMTSTPLIKYTEYQFVCGITTTNHIFGACLLNIKQRETVYRGTFGTVYYKTFPHILIYFPTGKCQIFHNVDTRIGEGFAHGCCANNYTIDFYRQTTVKHVAYKTPNDFTCTDIKKLNYFFRYRYAGLAQAADQREIQDALDDLHNYSPS